MLEKKIGLKIGVKKILFNFTPHGEINKIILLKNKTTGDSDKKHIHNTVYIGSHAMINLVRSQNSNHERYGFTFVLFSLICIFFSTTNHCEPLYEITAPL